MTAQRQHLTRDQHAALMDSRAPYGRGAVWWATWIRCYLDMGGDETLTLTASDARAIADLLDPPETR